MFARQINPHHSFYLGRENVKNLGRVGVVQPLKPIGMPNPNVAEKQAVKSVQRMKR